MPTLDTHSSLRYVKSLYLGDPGSGKTGSLAALVAAGYSLAIYDFDNLLGSLTQMVRHKTPGLLKNIHYQTFTDKMEGKAAPLTMVGNSMKVLPFTQGQATAFVRGLKQLTRWKEGEVDLGDPGQLGRDWVVVVDTLGRMAEAAYRYCWDMNPSAKEPQAVYFAAQQMVENVLALLFSEQFETHVIVTAHLDYKDNQLQVTKGFPRSIGSAMATKIGGYFNCVLQAEALSATKRVIHTQSTGIVDLKNPVSFRVNSDLPIETGLADFFKAVTDYQPQGAKTNG